MDIPLAALNKCTVVLVCVRFQYYNKGGMPSRSLTNDICAVCGQKILVDVEEEGFIEDTYQLSCGHMYPKAQLIPAGKNKAVELFIGRATVRPSIAQEISVYPFKECLCAASPAVAPDTVYLHFISLISQMLVVQSNLQ